MEQNGVRGAFFDADGVVRALVDRGHDFEIDGQRIRYTAPFTLSEVRYLPRAREAIDLARTRGYLPIFVTNQPDVGHGLIDPDEFGRIMEDLREKMGVGEEFVFFCPHVPSEGCACRKPSPGMIVEAAYRFGIDLSRSFMMGDMETDIEAGMRAGVGWTIRIVSNPLEGGESAADFMARDVFEAVEKWVRPGAPMSPVPSMCRCKRSFHDPSWPK